MNRRADTAVDGGIRLERFSPANASLVLRWRNAPHVRRNSLDDTEITLDSHLRFLESINTAGNRHYFVLRLDDEAVAALNVTVETGEATWGCYTATDLPGPVPGVFPLLLGIAGSLAFGPYECSALHSDVVHHNMAPQRLNRFLGIEECSERVGTRACGERFKIVSYVLERSGWPAVRARLDGILTRRSRTMLARFEADPRSRCLPPD